ncbi:MAG: c-type cytochrome, partial [Methylococcales bacterium]
MDKFTKNYFFHSQRTHENQRFKKLSMLVMMLGLTGCFSSSSDKDLSPIADAGRDATVLEQTVAALDGSGTAMQGQISGVSWQQTGGESVTLSDTTDPLATFTTPVTTETLSLTFQITVTDNDGRTATDSVTYSVAPVNDDPTAVAGTDQNIIGGETVTMQSASSDSDGSITGYSWIQTAGPTVTLTGADTETASFIAPLLEEITELVFDLTVTDNEGGTATDSVSINVGSKYALADGVNGGRLYSKFWATESGFSLTNSNLQDQSELDAISGKSNFFRCKQCHGWDRLGRDGGYSNRGPKTSRPNISPVNLAELVKVETSAQIFDAIKNGDGVRRDVTADLSIYDPAVDNAARVIGDQMPNFSQILTDDQIWDIVKYLKEEAYDTAQLYDITFDDGVYPNKGRTFSNIGKDGDVDLGDTIYNDKCGTCHGTQGTSFLVDHAEFTIGAFNRAKPYEEQHKIKFGNLGTEMPAHPDLSLDDAKNLLKALTDTVKYPDTQTAFNSADGIKGGQLYSKFWAEETGFSLSNSNLNNQTELDGITSKSNFFRCKQCHGWDRLGREGGYSNRAPKTSRPNIADLDLAMLAATATTGALFDAIKTGSVARRDVNTDLSTYDPATNNIIGDQMPNYSQILTDDQIWAIVNFLQREAFDTTQLYDITFDNGTYPNKGRTFSNIGKDGDATNGLTVYDNNCAACHGANGTSFLVDGDTYTVGRHVRSKPYEDQHKIKFGNLGSIMLPHPTLTTNDAKDLLKALTDEILFPDTQPVGLDGAALFVDKCGSCHTGNGLGSGSVKDITNHGVDLINAAIFTVPEMAVFSTLTTEEI